jgi:hypothetical protein
MPECREDECKPDGGWQDFLDFVVFQAQLLCWVMVCDLIVYFTGRLT